MERRAPRIDFDPGALGVVTRWGVVDGVVLRPGDRLLPGRPGDRVRLIAPRGRGRPMLAVRHHGRLLALPGRVPASPARWREVGTVAGVERELEHGAPRLGRVHVRFALHPRHPDADLAGARRAFRDGEYSGPELHGLCVRAVVAADRYAVDIGLAVGATAASADDLAVGLGGGVLRFRLLDEAMGQVIAGPWPSKQVDMTAASPAGIRSRADSPVNLRADGRTRRATVQPHRGRGHRDVADRQVLLPFVGDSASA
ncbi:MAG: hypothetical protein D6798_19280 [Deltaproteobacteria bacterium]|nr:MAG: hypothetical protein D6798_19280 [Deltaproteobacteria bacterium]